MVDNIASKKLQVIDKLYEFLMYETENSCNVDAEKVLMIAQTIETLWFIKHDC